MNYIVFDLEATCWENGPPPGYIQEIIEIGALRINSYGEIRGSFDRFVRPQRHPNLSLFCRELTQISQIDVNRALVFQEVIEEFIEWARLEEETYQLISWGGMDRRLLTEECIRHRLDYDWTFSHVNLKESYRLLTSNKKPMGLKKAIDREGFDFTGQQHRAISDAENLAKIFLKYLGDWDF